MALTNRQKNGIGCFVIAAILAGVAVNNTFFAEGNLAVTDASGLGVSRMVGAFLPAIAVLTVGVWLFQKRKA